MLTYPAIDPVIVRLGPVQIYWYGFMYLVGFTLAWCFGSWRAKRLNNGWNTEIVADLIFYGALGVVLGGRIGYMLFYNLPEFLHHPLSIFYVWQGGMAFHGGLIGVALAVWLYGRKINKNFFELTDFLMPLVPLGLAAGRIGNFINGELFGRITNVPWAMVFPNGGLLPRHPSQLYEFLGEGILLFLILWIYSRKPRPHMAVSGLFLLSYGLIRFILEFFREPDPQLGFVLFRWMTQGQILCVPMIICGFVILIYAYRKRPAHASLS
jgi:phosphatidylglycerol---prolipoprotein diacylglyceryl transferase